MNLFLDSSVSLAMCGSTTGASREICRGAAAQDWSLIVTAYVIAEVEANLPDLDPAAPSFWNALRP